MFAAVAELVGGRVLPCVILPGGFREKKGCGNPVSETGVREQNIKYSGLLMGMDFFSMQLEGVCEHTQEAFECVKYLVGEIKLFQLNRFP